jgi:hypothetical protein
MPSSPRMYCPFDQKAEVKYQHYIAIQLVEH